MSTAREEAALSHLLALAPPGGAFPRERSSNWARALAPLAFEHARVEGEAENLVLEVDPRIAPRMLADYERVLGDDPCIGPVAALPLEIRRSLAHQRWTNRGGATPAYFIGMAAALGFTVTIQEFRPLVSGFRSGAPAADEKWIFAWRVHFTGETAETAAAVICSFQRARPAHTLIAFTFG